MTNNVPVAEQMRELVTGAAGRGGEANGREERGPGDADVGIGCFQFRFCRLYVWARQKHLRAKASGGLLLAE